MGKWMDRDALSVCLCIQLSIKCGLMPHYQPKDQTKNEEGEVVEEKQVITEHPLLVRHCARCFCIHICHLNSQNGYFLNGGSKQIIRMFHKRWEKNCPQNNKKRETYEMKK